MAWNYIKEHGKEEAIPLIRSVDVSVDVLQLSTGIVCVPIAGPFPKPGPLSIFHSCCILRRSLLVLFSQ